jgi:uncharacterized membrane protein YesL
MTGFFIRKAFYDGWDNLLQLVLLNLMCIAIGFGGFSLAQLTATTPYLSIAILAVAVIAECILMMAMSSVLAGVAAYKSFSFRDFGRAVKETWLHGLLFGVLIGFLTVVLFVTFPYYIRMGNLFGFAIAVVLFWTAVIFILSFQWFLPIRCQLEPNFAKALKKCFIIFFDNPGFSVFMFFYSIILAALSAVMIFLVPGVAGIILAQNNAFRLRMYKYDWIEQNPGMDFKTARKSVPWGELLAEDEETVGHRSFKSFIFPWKD